MPYDYQDLNPKERAQLLDERRQRGYPLHAPPHPFREAGWYLLTAANFKHRPVMKTATRRTQFQSALLEAFTALEAQIAAWVILPNHYHMLAGVDSLDDASAAMKQLHGSTSRQWNVEDNLTGRRRVWYKFSDRWIRNERHYHRTLNYIHYNPVKHGYVEDPYAWQWSSVHWYFDEKGRQWLRDTWRHHPIDRMGVGWDEYD